MTVPENRQALCIALFSRLSFYQYFIHHGNSKETVKGVKDDE